MGEEGSQGLRISGSRRQVTQGVHGKGCGTDRTGEEEKRNRVSVRFKQGRARRIVNREGEILGGDIGIFSKDFGITRS